MSQNGIPTSRAAAAVLDAADPLSSARARFALPDGVIYLDGHSLGPATHGALEAVETTAREDWAKGLIRSWNAAGWIDLPAKVGAQLARLIGVPDDSVIVSDSVSVNLFKLVAAALPLAGARAVIVEADEFPTDQYIAQGLCDLVGASLVRASAGEGMGALTSQGGVLIKSAVNYRTARIADIEAHEHQAKASGGLVIWDLSHAAGVLDLNLARRGAPAFIYAAGGLAEQMRSPLQGWFGHAAPFAFDADYAPKSAVGRFAAGTPGILSLVAMGQALEAFEGVDLAAAAAKARALGDLCLSRAEALGLPSLSPGIGETRGGHVSLQHEEGYAIVQALIAQGIIADFRAPDAVRFGFSPLYVRHVDVWDAMEELAEILETRAWDTPAFRTRATVT